MKIKKIKYKLKFDEKNTKQNFNFKTSDGTLINGNGFSKLKVLNGIGDYEEVNFPKNYFPMKCFEYYYNIGNNITKNIVFIDKKYDFCLLTSGKNGNEVFTPLIVISGDVEKITEAHNLKINNNDCLIFLSKENGIIVFAKNITDGTYSIEQLDNMKVVNSLAIFYNHLFVISNLSPFGVAYSDEKDIKKWETADFNNANVLNFSNNLGRAQKLVAFKKGIYVFYESGIGKITPTNNVNVKFKIEPVCQFNSKINLNTITAGDEIAFVCDDGIYTFNGAHIKKLEIDKFESFDKNQLDKIAMAFLGDKLYIAAKINFDDSLKVGCENNEYYNNTLFEIDINKQTVNLTRGIDIYSFQVSINENKSKLIYLTSLNFDWDELPDVVAGELEKDGGNLYGEPLEKVWMSREIDFDKVDKIKTLTQLRMKTESELTLKIKTDLDEVNLLITPNQTGEVEVTKLSVRGYDFTFEIKANNIGKTKIYEPEFVFEYLEDEV